MNELDVQIFRYLHDALSGVLMPMVALSVIGGGWGSFSVFPLLAWNRTRRFGLSLAGVCVTTAIAVFVLKRLVGRARPFNAIPDIHAINPPTDFSFPSGHAAGSFAFAVFIAIVLVRTKRPDAQALAALLVLLAVGVGLSRIALGVHYPGDVVAGAVLGSAIATAGARFYSQSDASKASTNQPN